MRFIGNKENLLDKIFQTLQSKQIKGNSFFDFFAGTANVGKYFKKLNYQIFSSDLLYFSYILQKAYIQNNEDVNFEILLPKISIKPNSIVYSPLDLVITYLDNLKPLEGFIFQNYTPEGTITLQQPRMFYSNGNGKKFANKLRFGN
jgi:adenine-specific DNA-methyltransferase